MHELDNFPSFEGIFRKDQEGQLMLTPGGKPRMLDKRLRQVLGQVADKHGFVVEKTLQRINRNDGLTYSLANCEAGPELEKKLFFGPVTTLTGRVRGRTTYTQRHNTPFQGLAADGAKLAVWNLYRAGIRVVAHIHDEFVVELPEGGDFNSAAQQVDKICCDSNK